jgi:hypothetical protein
MSSFSEWKHLSIICYFWRSLVNASAKFAYPFSFKFRLRIYVEKQYFVQLLSCLPKSGPVDGLGSYEKKKHHYISLLRLTWTIIYIDMVKILYIGWFISYMSYKVLITLYLWLCYGIIIEINNVKDKFVIPMIKK